MDLEEAKRKHDEPLSDYHSYRDCIVCWLIPEVERLKLDLLEGDLKRQRKLWAEIHKLREALEEIKLGRGAYDQDQFQHAINTIESMKQIADKALKGEKEKT